MSLRSAIYPVLLAATLLPGTPVGGGGQELARPAQEWRSVRSANFDIHFPSELQEWALHAGAELERIRESVEGRVGYSSRRVTVLVDDPMNVSNGYAMPGPLMFFYPTPPEPRSTIGEGRDWAELLAVHEYAHIVHLGRPSRNRAATFLTALLPASLGPIVASPRWVIEGYATLIEGEITASGRPRGLWRPTVLRTLAAQGALPSYSQLGADERFYGGAMAYLAGSAFLEWLEERGGEQSLVNVWRRMTARTPRTFAGSFSGVYGAEPSELYGRFLAELTAGALAFEQSVLNAGLAEGTAFERFDWFTGDPALSPDGAHLVVVERSRLAPSRVVILSTHSDSASDAERAAAERARMRDPEDVPAVSRGPRPHRRVATLTTSMGGGWDHPRFTRDGRSVLLIRNEVLGDGTVRPDLYEWSWESGALRRVTRSAGVRHPDPAPDGSWAAATRCTGGSCSLVRVDLADGQISTMVPGTIARSFYRPRISPDGRTIAVAVTDAGRWRAGLVDAETGLLTLLDFGNDATAHFDVAFTPDGRHLLAVAAGAAFNIDMLELASGRVRRITNTATAVFAPEPTVRGDSLYFLALHARGYNVNVAPVPESSVAVPDEHPGVAGTASWAAAPGGVLALRRPAGADAFASTPGPSGTTWEVRRYGTGTQRLFWAPVGGADAGSFNVGAVVSMADPVGRLSTAVAATYGSERGSAGVSAGSVWRGWPTALSLSAATETRTFLRDGNVEATRNSYRGAQGSLQRDFFMRGTRVSAALGGWGGELRHFSDQALSRKVGFARLNASFAERVGSVRYTQSVGLHFENGVTGGEGWARGTAQLEAGVHTPGTALQLQLRRGSASTAMPTGEHFIVGPLHSAHLGNDAFGHFVSLPLVRHIVGSGTEYTHARTSLSGVLPLTAFAEWISVTGASAHREITTVGLSFETVTQRLPQVGAPGAWVAAGVGIPLSGRLPRRVAAYLSLSIHR